jgi:uncharacterized protein YxeA
MRFYALFLIIVVSLTLFVNPLALPVYAQNQATLHIQNAYLFNNIRDISKVLHLNRTITSYSQSGHSSLSGFSNTTIKNSNALLIVSVKNTTSQKIIAIGYHETKKDYNITVIGSLVWNNTKRGFVSTFLANIAPKSHELSWRHISTKLLVKLEATTNGFDVWSSQGSQ